MAQASKDRPGKVSGKKSGKKLAKKTARVAPGAKRGFRFGLHDLMMEADPEYAKKREDWVRFLYLENRRMEPRTKELVIIGILAVLKSPPPHIKLHIDQAVKAGATSSLCGAERHQRRSVRLPVWLQR